MMPVCQWCNVGFKRPMTRGRIPNYCKQGHRQRAYEERVILRRIEEALSNECASDISSSRVQHPDGF